MRKRKQVYYPHLDLIWLKLEKQHHEILDKIVPTLHTPEQQELWRQLEVVERKMDWHLEYGKPLYYSRRPNVNYTTEDIEEMFSEVDTDSIPEMDYRLLASKRSSTLRTLMQKLKDFLTRPMRLPKG